MQTINEILSKEFSVELKYINSTLELIDGGNTIPFIARYRKEVTGNLSDEILRDLYERLNYLRNLQARREEVTRLIDEQGKLTEELMNAINNASIMSELEDIYRPYKQKKKTRASIAKEKGLEPLADIIFAQQEKADINIIAKQFVNVEKKVESEEQAIAGALDIIAENISDNAEYRKFIKTLCIKDATIDTEGTTEEKTVYEIYYKFSELISKIPSHRILAINRGETEKILKVKIVKPQENIIDYIEKDVIKDFNSQYAKLLKDTIQDAYTRLIEPSIERELRTDLTERAEEKAIRIFGHNVKQLLLQAPIKNKVVLGFDPAYRTGCKIAVIDEMGKLLETTTIYPTQPQNDVEKSKKVLLDLINKHNVGLIAIGNGTASRESETFVAEILKEVKDVYYAIVNEAGASVYSASKLATEEYPDINVSLRGAISIARRLQDPLSELVKIDTKSIGVGQYQHDVNQKKLDESLTGVVENAVNSVGIDVNTATPSLLAYIAGINMSIAKNIVTYREEKGRIKERKELLKVAKLGKSAFEQCAGFLRVLDGKNALDNTGVHPESYEATENLLKNIGFEKADLVNKEKLNELKEKLKNVNTENIANELNIGELTIKDIIQELSKPGRDPREEMPKLVLRSDVLKFEDLKIGMILTGTVRNAIDFGAFVDIGIKNDGLVHISQMCDKFINHPLEVVSVGDIVNVKVIDIDNDRQKVKLSMRDVKN